MHNAITPPWLADFRQSMPAGATVAAGNDGLPDILLSPEDAAGSRLTRWQGQSTTCGQLPGIRNRGWWQFTGLKSTQQSICFPTLKKW